MHFQTPEQRSRKLQAAQKELSTLIESHRETLTDIRRARHRLHELTGPSVPNDDEGKRKRQEAITNARHELDRLMAKRNQLRDQIEAAKDAERHEGHQAAVDLVDSQQKDYGQHFKAFVVARLSAIADEAVAVAHCVDIREGLRVALGVRRDHKLARLPHAFDLNNRAEHFESLRQETRELIDAGIITTKDIPTALAKAWNL